MNSDVPSDTNRQGTRALRNVVRAPYVTCRWCTAPTMGFEACQRCADRQRISGVADVVAPLMYAIAGTKSAALLRDYKNHPSRAVRDRCCQSIRSLVQSALSHHEDCLATAVGTPITIRTIVPSLTYRPGVHPFAAIATELGAAHCCVLAAAPTTTCHRVLMSREKFEVTQPDAVVGRHVLVLDDIWTTGSNAQSAALTLRRSWAAAVSVMVVGRWLNPSYPPTKAFLERYRDTAFSPYLCPVSGHICRSGNTSGRQLL
jgi:hypothetical protein